ncbi:MAG: hypothetical protein OWT28_06400 [Firmicutes bacterium]|nr:hypothetical protein [Bacillota bacterium]
MDNNKKTMYTEIGIGSAVGISLLGLGVYDAIKTGIAGSSQALSNCEKQYANEVLLYNQALKEFLDEDAKKNVPFSSPQQDYLNKIIEQENKIAKTCFADNWLAKSAETISYAIALGVIAVFGALAYKFIKKKGYLKPPRGKNGEPYYTPATSMANMQMGIFDYEKTIGVLPVYWNSNGVNALNNTASSGDTLTQEFVTSMEEADLITEEIGATIITVSSALIAEELSLALLAFA